MVVHIPRALYQWRQVPGSLLTGVEAKPYAPNAGRRALDDYLQRNDILGQVVADPNHLGFWTMRRKIVRPGKVTILIPVPGDPGELHRCLVSLTTRTTYQPYEILLIAPDQPAAAMRDYLARTPYRVVHSDGPSAIPHLFNQAAQVADGEYLLLLDSACEARASMRQSVSVVVLGRFSAP